MADISSQWLDDDWPEAKPIKSIFILFIVLILISGSFSCGSIQPCANSKTATLKIEELETLKTDRAFEPAVKKGPEAVRQGTADPGTKADKNAAMQKAVKLRMPFIANQGQVTDECVRFYARTFGGTAYVTEKGEMVYSFTLIESKGKTADQASRPEKIKGWTLKERLVGASNSAPLGIDQTRTKVNCFIGNDKGKWKTNIPAYNTVCLGEVYEGINLSLNAYGKNIEKVFTVRPGADPEGIRLKTEGATSLKINDKGELELLTGLGTVKFSSPVAYQEKDGTREKVRVAYNLDKDTYGFKTGNYDKTLPLVIDPWVGATFVGGTANDMARGVVADSLGNTYVAGYTASADYPETAGAWSDLQSFPPSSNDIFVSKFNPDLTILEASTYLGGNSNDEAYAIASDEDSGDFVIYVTGRTSSGDFPTTTGETFTGGEDVFIFRLSADLDVLEASTLLGGTAGEWGNALLIDPSGGVNGYAYVAGWTISSDFVSPGSGFDDTYNGNGDAFIASLNCNDFTIVNETFFGGDLYDEIYSIAQALDGNIYATGVTGSINISVTGGYDTTHNGNNDVFVAKISQDLNTFDEFTYIGGSSNDYAYSIALDDSGNVYVAGQTASSGYPITAGAFDDVFQTSEGFISKFNAALDSLLASTFLGGASNDYVQCIATGYDAVPGEIAVAGWTASSDFYITPGSCFDSDYDGSGDAYVLRINTDLSTVNTSSYLGGSGSETVYGLFIDVFSSLLMTGSTDSIDFSPITPANINSGGFDAFVFKTALRPLTDGLVAYYPFNGDANDESGNNNHGITQNGVLLVPDRFGIASSAYYFDGLDDSINSTTTMDLGSGSATFCAWVNTSSSDSGVVLTNGQFNYESGFIMGANWLNPNSVLLGIGEEGVSGGSADPAKEVQTLQIPLEVK